MDNTENKNGRSADHFEEIESMGAVSVINGRHRIHCMSVIGQIEGHSVLPPETKSTKYEHLMPQLVAVEQSPEIEGLLILLNTIGGDVEAGLAIAELISGMKNHATIILT